MADYFESGFVGNNEPAWHEKAKVVAGAVNAEEARKLGGLEWDVETHPIFDPWGKQIKDRLLVVRNSDYKHLGIVSKNYVPVTNERMFQFMDQVVGKIGGAHYDTAGSVRGGEIVFATIDLRRTYEVVQGDPIATYLACSNGHNGEWSFRTGKTDIRQVCWNTVQAAWGDMQRKHAFYMFAHKGDILDAVAAAQDAINIALREVQTTIDAMTLLAITKCTDEALKTYVDTVFPMPRPPKKGAKESTMEQYHYLRELTARRRLRILALSESGIGTDIPGVKGTYYGAYNAVTEWTDHEAYGSAEKQLQQIWFGDRAEIRESAFTTALAACKGAVV